jgi:diadenosine tetraphosphate (Ap4A) HIT family hydrolase
MTDCLFCRIATKTVNAVIVWEDSDIVAFLDSARKD